MNRVSLIISAFVVSAMILSSCGGGTSSGLTIGEQVWMTENLNVDKFRNGDPIPHAKTKQEWKKAGRERQPAWCYYDNKPENGTKYGKLYNWYAVNDPRVLAPEGWHIPSYGEWIKLTDYLGEEKSAGDKLKSISGWINNDNGTKSCFGGIRGVHGFFSLIDENGFWWSSTETDITSAWYRELGVLTARLTRDDCDKASGISVRCIRD